VYVSAVTALDNYFQSRTNIPYERHVFRQVQQRDAESIDQFVTRLRQQADLCSFDNQKDDNIRDQLIDKCRSATLRKQLLEKCEITLLQALETARAKEAAEKQAETMTHSSQAEVKEVCSVKPNWDPVEGWGRIVVVEVKVNVSDVGVKVTMPKIRNAQLGIKAVGSVKKWGISSRSVGQT